MRWSELPSDRLEIELAKLGITINDLIADAEDVPELAAALDRLTSDRARRLAVLQWFGDQGHPQPAERTDWPIWGRTPDWGRLPSPKDDVPRPARSTGAVRHRGGRPRKLHPGVALREAARMLQHEPQASLSAVGRSATAKARAAIADEELIEERRWQSGFVFDDVDALREALDAVKPLVRWTPNGVEIRENASEVFRNVDDFDWCEIPEPA